ILWEFTQYILHDQQKRDAEFRVCTPDGILLRVNRSIQVEGAFGVIKEDHGFRRFLTRGKQKTETQFFILAFAFNIRKLCARLDSNRIGSSIFQS
ncbi:MAG: transposase, partial [Eubacteriales bacterium]